MREQVIKRLVDYNFTVTAYPDVQPRPAGGHGRRAAVGRDREARVGQVIQPDEAWIRDYLGLPTE